MTELTRCQCGRVHSARRGGSIVCPCGACIAWDYAQRRWKVLGPNGPAQGAGEVHMPVGATQDVPPARPR